MEIANVFTAECAAEMEHDEFRIGEAQLGAALGAELIGGSVYEIDPGQEAVAVPGKLDTLSAKGERILLARNVEPAKYWDGD
jgi:hypothetical protein